MRFHSVHSRELEASREEVAGLVAGLGSDNDLLWPTERWPPARLDSTARSRSGHAAATV